MKQKLLYNPLLHLTFLFVYTLIAGCSKKNSPDTPVDLVSSTLTKGTWKIESFLSGGVDKTSDFNAYVFTFSSGTVTATKSGLTITGTWSSYYTPGSDIFSGRNNFKIEFASPIEFTRLSSVWYVNDQAENRMGFLHEATPADNL